MLRYFIIPQTTVIVIIFVILGVALSFIQKALSTSTKIPHSFPVSQITSIGEPVVVILGILIILVLCLNAWINYSSVKFMFDEFAFHIQKGFLSKAEIAIPYHQIQNVSYEQDFSEKTWGIARVIVETAGTNDSHDEQSGGTLPILDNNLALALQQELLSRSSGK